MSVAPTPGHEEVRPLNLGIEWDGGAPFPHLVQSEHRAFLAFFLLSDSDLDEGIGVNLEDVRQVDPTDMTPASVGIIVWQRCHATVFGTPNDEAISGHRLWGRGLENVIWAGEVYNSAWIAGLERMNRVHPLHWPARYAPLRHFVLLFKDKTFECVAEGYTIQTVVDSMPNVVVHLARRLVE